MSGLLRCAPPASRAGKGPGSAARDRSLARAAGTALPSSSHCQVGPSSTLRLLGAQQYGQTLGWLLAVLAAMGTPHIQPQSREGSHGAQGYRDGHSWCMGMGHSTAGRKKCPKAVSQPCCPVAATTFDASKKTSQGWERRARSWPVPTRVVGGHPCMESLSEWPCHGALCACRWVTWPYPVSSGLYRRMRCYQQQTCHHPKQGHHGLAGPRGTQVGPNFATGWALNPGGQQRWGKEPPEPQGPSRLCPPSALSSCTQARGTTTAALTGFCTLLSQALSSGISSPAGGTVLQRSNGSAVGAADSALLLLLLQGMHGAWPQHGHWPGDSHSHSTPEAPKGQPQGSRATASTQRTATGQRSHLATVTRQQSPPSSTQGTATKQRSPQGTGTGQHSPWRSPKDSRHRSAQHPKDRHGAAQPTWQPQQGSPVPPGSTALSPRSPLPCPACQGLCARHAARF
ncbi:uncharacterized protein LOC120508480 [Passer montanus]|uniref:uncharacterized protein LOC120508480 n=1 Tax=Passer montanus TaxID=9160 RepID=UPI00196157D1|nr:uncharacterized protein LOC120508480 [Passer montanus]XP_039578083.1 uncharacterized protein LOC120508480 [Passer montanus]XP_039578084.1 uncharacterized protein LOC120508480 [Passer montanus]XP_039578085.1 uncharacterized protein LOC120508480 [Passer montanus]